MWSTDPWVREAVAGDAAAVEALWAAVAAEGRWLGAEAPLPAGWGDRFLAQLEDPDGTWFVVEDEGAVVGAEVVYQTSGRANLAMAVVDGRRGEGLGRRLLEVGVDWARSHGCHKVTLEVWPHNARAIGLYQSAGFVIEGRRRRQYRRRNGELWDSVVMGLVLDTDSPSGPTGSS